MLPSQKRTRPYEALSACVQPQEKSDRLTDKPGDWFHSYDRSPDVKAKVLGSSKKTRRWVTSVSRHERSGTPTVVRQRNRMATFLHTLFSGFVPDLWSKSLTLN